MTPLKLRPLELAAVVLAVLEAAATFYVSRHGPPGPVAVHFGWSGRPDHWVGRQALAVGAAGQALLGLAIVAALGFAARRAEAGEARRRGLQVGQGLIAGVFALIAAFHLSRAAGVGSPPPGVLLSLVALLVGAGLGRVPPNALVGVRTPWSLASRLAWDRSNRLAGRLFAAVGLIGLFAAALAPAGAGLHIVVVALVASALVAAAESWRVWRTDPDRLLV